MTYPQRNLEFDALRSLAMLYVVGFWHLFDYSNALFFPGKSVMRLVTDCLLGLFVFISGHLLSDRYLPIKRDAILGFYRRRFLRIYPLYLIALTGFLLVDIIDLYTFSRAVILTNMLIPHPLFTLWFVTMIFLFYLITPLYLMSYRHRRTILVTIILYAALIVINRYTGRIDLRLPKFLIAFGAGILAANSPNLQWLVRDKRSVLTALGLFGVAVYLYTIAQNIYVKMVISDFGILLSLPFLSYLGAFTSRYMNEKLLLRFSYATFSMYLFHRLIFRLGVKVYQPEALLPSILYLIGLLLPVTVIISYYCQRLYDAALRRCFPKLR